MRTLVRSSSAAVEARGTRLVAARVLGVKIDPLSPNRLGRKNLGNASRDGWDPGWDADEAYSTKNAFWFENGPEKSRQVLTSFLDVFSCTLSDEVKTAAAPDLRTTYLYCVLKPHCRAAPSVREHRVGSVQSTAMLISKEQSNHSAATAASGVVPLDRWNLLTRDGTQDATTGAEEERAERRRSDSNDTGRAGRLKTKRVITSEFGLKSSAGISSVKPDVANDPTSTDSWSEAKTLFLAALRVFLLSEYDRGAGPPWLGSTKHLSVASLHTCEECRMVAALHVRIADNTPRSLWATRENHDGPKFRSATAGDLGNASVVTIKASRVPAARVVKITWDKLSVDEMTDSGKPHATSPGLCEVDEIVFGDGFNQMVSGIAWPKGIKRLTFGCCFNQPVRAVTWPPDLLELSFGRCFDRPIDGVKWPRTLQRLIFGHAFSQSCSGIVWPGAILELIFGHEYNHPITEIAWPTSLKRLSFGRKFNQSIDGVCWPPALTKLTLGWSFDQSLKEVALPSTLEVLSIAGVYDRPLDFAFPARLKKLTLGGHFNQPLGAIQWPDQLEEISFGWAFNQSLAEVTWPPKLLKLSLGYRFNQPAAHIRWPQTLRELDLGVFSRQSLEGIVWPQSFRTLLVSRAFDLTGVVLPKEGRVCRRGHTYCNVQCDIKQWYNVVIIL